jgi:16S rRNA processing protein RimM
MGRIAGPHGVRGAVKVQPHSAEPASLLDHDEWWLKARLARDAWTAYRVVAARGHGAMLVAEFEGVASREAATALRGSEVGVPRESLPRLADNEYYEADLVGMAVVNRSGTMLGQVSEFAESGAHPILRVVNGEGSERLIPWVPQYIVGVDAGARRIDVDWAEDY